MSLRRPSSKHGLIPAQVDNAPHLPHAQKGLLLEIVKYKMERAAERQWVLQVYLFTKAATRNSEGEENRVSQNSCSRSSHTMEAYQASTRAQYAEDEITSELSLSLLIPKMGLVTPALPHRMEPLLKS